MPGREVAAFRKPVHTGAEVVAFRKPVHAGAGEGPEMEVKEHRMEGQEKKEDRRVRRTKKLLVQALTELMQQKQVKEITVRELTDLADMNRGTFYLYYKDIYDMLDRIEDSLFNGLNDILDRHGEDVAALEPGAILPDLLRFIQENREMVQVLLSPHGDMNFLHRLNGVLREKCLRYLKRTEPVAKEDTFDYQYSFLVFGTAGLIRAWVNRDCAESPEEMGRLADEMLRRGNWMPHPITSLAQR